MKKILLLDIENQPKKIRELRILLEQYTQVVLVYAASHLNIALDDLTELSRAVQEQRLLILKMPKAGVNSADFGLTFIAGRLSVQLEQGSSIDVMSNDTAMSYAVDLLKQIDIQSTQIKHLIEVEKTIEPAKTVVPHIQQVPFFDEKMKRALPLLIKNQPKKMKALMKSLVSWCDFSKAQAEELIQNLQAQNLLVIKENKLEYNDKQIKKILSKADVLLLPTPVEEKMTSAYIQTRPHLMRIKQYCDYLNKVMQNKPSKLEALGNSLKAILKFENDAQVIHMINLLKKHQILQIHEKKIVYLQSNIQLWSSIQ